MCEKGSSVWHRLCICCKEEHLNLYVSVFRSRPSVHLTTEHLHAKPYCFPRVLCFSKVAHDNGIQVTTVVAGICVPSHGSQQNLPMGEQTQTTRETGAKMHYTQDA